MISFNGSSEDYHMRIKGLERELSASKCKAVDATKWPLHAALVNSSPDDEVLALLAAKRRDAVRAELQFPLVLGLHLEHRASETVVLELLAAFPHVVDLIGFELTYWQLLKTGASEIVFRAVLVASADKWHKFQIAMLRASEDTLRVIVRAMLEPQSEFPFRDRSFVPLQNLLSGVDDSWPGKARIAVMKEAIARGSLRDVTTPDMTHRFAACFSRDSDGLSGLFPVVCSGANCFSSFSEAIENHHNPPDWASTDSENLHEKAVRELYYEPMTWLDMMRSTDPVVKTLRAWHHGGCQWKRTLCRMFLSITPRLAAEAISDFACGLCQCRICELCSEQEESEEEEDQDFESDEDSHSRSIVEDFRHVDAARCPHVSDQDVSDVMWAQQVERLILAGHHCPSLIDRDGPDDGSRENCSQDSWTECHDSASNFLQAWTGDAMPRYSQFGDTIYLLRFTRCGKRLHQALHEGRHLESIRITAMHHG